MNTLAALMAVLVCTTTSTSAAEQRPATPAPRPGAFELALKAAVDDAILTAVRGLAGSREKAEIAWDEPSVDAFVLPRSPERVFVVTIPSVYAGERVPRPARPPDYHRLVIDRLRNAIAERAPQLPADGRRLTVAAVESGGADTLAVQPRVYLVLEAADIAEARARRLGVDDVRARIAVLGEDKR